MLDLFVQWLPRLPGETEAAMRPALMDDIMRLTGKPTIDQMILLADKSASAAARRTIPSGISKSSRAIGAAPSAAAAPDYKAKNLPPNRC